jgi:dTDP-4-amino-4,6-dideoxygalactose transaminase
LNKLPYLKNTARCPVSEDIAKRILCLPLYYGLDENSVVRISDIISKSLKNET